MKVKEWMIAGGIAALGAAATWGSMRSTIEDHERRISILEELPTQVSEMDGKLDIIINTLQGDNKK